MRNWTTAFISSLCIGSVGCEATFFYNSGHIDFDIGYRQDLINWEANLSRFKGIVEFEDEDLRRNLIAQQSWKQLQSIQVMTNFDLIMCGHIYLKGRASAGRILRGKHSLRNEIEFDDDDTRSNRRRRRSRRNHRREVIINDVKIVGHELEEILLRKGDGSADAGTVLDLIGGVGYQFSFLGGRSTITPIVGYGHDQQRIKMDDFEICFSKFHRKDVGPIKNFRAFYNTKWYGPWVGADFYLNTLCNNLFFVGSLEYHWVRFRGKGDQNMPHEVIKAYRQHSEGAGQVYQVGLNYACECWSWGILGNFQRWETSGGTMRLNEAVCPGIDVKLEEINWQSWSIMADVGYDF